MKPSLRRTLVRPPQQNNSASPPQKKRSRLESIILDAAETTLTKNTLANSVVENAVDANNSVVEENAVDANNSVVEESAIDANNSVVGDFIVPELTERKIFNLLSTINDMNEQVKFTDDKIKLERAYKHLCDARAISNKMLPMKRFCQIRRVTFPTDVFKVNNISHNMSCYCMYV